MFTLKIALLVLALVSTTGVAAKIVLRSRLNAIDGMHKAHPKRGHTHTIGF